MTPSKSSAPEGHCVLEGYRPLYRPPEKFRERDRVAPVVRNAIQACAAGTSLWPLLLSGEAGTGKSCSALCMIDHFGGWFVQLSEFCDLLIRAGKNELSWSSGYRRTVGELWDGWEKAHLAVLDEIAAKERISDFHYDVLKRCIDSREGKPLVVISNISLQELATVYDDRIVSRLCCATTLELTGDQRLERKLRLVGT